MGHAMSIYNFSMPAAQKNIPLKEYLLKNQHLFANECFSCKSLGQMVFDSSEPQKFIHVVDLIYDGMTENESVDEIKFATPFLYYSTNKENQFLHIDISILNHPDLSKKFKFVGISCDKGQEPMIEICQCIGFADKRTNLVAHEQHEIEHPNYVFTVFKMPPVKDRFSFFLLVKDLTIRNKDPIKAIDPGIGNGPPKK